MKGNGELRHRGQHHSAGQREEGLPYLLLSGSSHTVFIFYLRFYESASKS